MKKEIRTILKDIITRLERSKELKQGDFICSLAVAYSDGFYGEMLQFMQDTFDISAVRSLWNNQEYDKRIKLLNAILNNRKTFREDIRKRGMKTYVLRIPDEWYTPKELERRTIKASLKNESIVVGRDTK